MKKKKFIKYIIVTFIFVLMVDHTVYANEWEDEDSTYKL